MVLVFTGLNALVSQISQCRKTLTEPLFPRLVPTSCGGLDPHISGYCWLPWKKLPRDLITPLHAVCCVQPATHTKPKHSSVSVAHHMQLSHQSIWYLTTVLLVNRISLTSHRCDIPRVFLAKSKCTICFERFCFSLPTAKHGGYSQPCASKWKQFGSLWRVWMALKQQKKKKHPNLLFVLKTRDPKLIK